MSDDDDATFRVMVVKDDAKAAAICREGCFGVE